MRTDTIFQAMADRAYCNYIEQLRRDECLGWEHKVKTGKFGEVELKAHKKAAEYLGAHRAFSEAAKLIAASAPVAPTFQQRVQPWMMECFGPEISADRNERNHRFFEESTELVERLWANAQTVRAGLQQMGFDTGHSATPIVPVMLGEATLAQAFSRRLFEEGVFAMAIGYPTVPMGKARVRVMNSAAHSSEDLERALDVFAQVGRELGVTG